MIEPQDRRLIRSAIENPRDGRVYDRIVVAEGDRNPECAIRAARHLCALVPRDRRCRGNLLVLLQRAKRWDELARAVPRANRALPPRRSHPVDLDQAIARHDWLMDCLRERAAEGWTPSTIEGHKRRSSLNRQHLAQFRRSEVSGGTQTIPDRPRRFGLLDISRLYPPYGDADMREAEGIVRLQRAGLLSRLFRCDSPGIDWFDAAALDDERFGDRTVGLPGLGRVTGKSIQAAYYACRIMSMIPKAGVVLEIGGGFGALASRLLAIRPDITYVLTDLPVNMVLSHTYLASLYGEAVAGLWEDSDRPAPGQRVLVVPPWRLAALPLKVDLTVNTMSFQHMDERNHGYYGNVMKALGTRALYHVNRNVHKGDPATDTMAVPADAYSFMAGFEVAERREFDGKWIEVIARARP